MRAKLINENYSSETVQEVIDLLYKFSYSVNLEDGDEITCISEDNFQELAHQLLDISSSTTWQDAPKNHKPDGVSHDDYDDYDDYDDDDELEGWAGNK